MTADSRQYNLSTDERSLRRREVEAEEKAATTQMRTIIVQTLALLIAAFAALSAGFGAWQAAKAVNNAQNNASRQAVDNRLAIAITAIGQRSPAGQVAGLTLLRRNVASQIYAAAKEPADRKDAYDAYATSLGIIDVYLRMAAVPGQASQLADVYAADELKLLLDMGADVRKISGGHKPSVDLSLVELPGVSWPKINFGSLGAAFMPRIDLRGANLVSSSWGHATLIHANFQCADLHGADLRWADLSGADLRGANLSGARLPLAAQLKGVQTEGAFGSPQGLKIVKPSYSWGFGSCRS